MSDELVFEMPKEEGLQTRIIRSIYVFVITFLLITLVKPSWFCLKIKHENILMFERVMIISLLISLISIGIRIRI